MNANANRERFNADQWAVRGFGPGTGGARVQPSRTRLRCCVIKLSNSFIMKPSVAHRRSVLQQLLLLQNYAAAAAAAAAATSSRCCAWHFRLASNRVESGAFQEPTPFHVIQARRCCAGMQQRRLFCS